MGARRPQRLSSKAGLSRPGSSGSRTEGMPMSGPPEQSKLSDKAAGRSMTVVPFSFSIFI